VNNPFVFGESVPADDPDGLADREEELALLRRSMAGGRNVIVIAPRRYGKTSLIKRAVVEARSAGGRSGWVSLGDCASQKDVAETLLAGVLSGPASWEQRLHSGVRRRLESLGAAVRLHSGPSDSDVELSVTLRPAEGGWRDTIAEVLRTLRDAGDDGRPVSFVIDEFQAAHEIDPAIPGVVKRLVDELRGVSLVLSGSKRHLMEQLTSGGAAPLARIGTMMALPKIPREAMVDFLMRRATKGGRLLAESVAGAIYDAADGIPNECQQIAWFAHEASTRRITLASVTTAVDLLLRQARFEYEAIWERTSPSGRRLLKALAADGPLNSLASRAMVDRVEVANASSVKAALRALERDDLVEHGPDGWRVANPLFALWLRERAGRD
jgi:hypothetical protein